jgi:hypothetical protein
MIGAEVQPMAVSSILQCFVVDALIIISILNAYERIKKESVGVKVSNRRLISVCMNGTSKSCD